MYHPFYFTIILQCIFTQPQELHFSDSNYYFYNIVASTTPVNMVNTEQGRGNMSVVCHLVNT